MSPETTSRPSQAASVLADPGGWFAKEVQPHDAQLKAFLRGNYPDVRDVEDVVQESYLRLWRTATREPIQSARAFLFLVARRLALNVLRKDRNAPFVSDSHLPASAVPADEADAETQLVRKERVSLLADALLTLPPRCREATILHKLEGLSQRQVAVRLKISERTVEAHVRQGVSMCRTYLRRQGVDFGGES